MTRTLHFYLYRELLRITLLGLVAFTLVMTVIAIIEPLRKEGLSSEQITKLFIFTVPMMISLTLPVAALFATTIIYGRFSQDNEFMACRASGISTMTVLRPALVLGLIVTVFSLALSNFITPYIISNIGQAAVKANAKGIFNHKLLQQNIIKYGQHTIHADRLDPQTGTAIGVAFSTLRERKRENNLEFEHFMGIASKAKFDFVPVGEETFVKVHSENLFTFNTSSNRIVPKASVFIFEQPIPNEARDKVAFYHWNKLWETLDKPEQHKEIQRELEGLRRKISYNLLANSVARAMENGKPYEKFSNNQETYVIRAGKVSVQPMRGALQMWADSLPDGRQQRVEVSIERPGQRPEIIQADAGEIEAAWGQIENRSLVTITLTGRINVEGARQDESSPQRLDVWQRGNIPIPADVREEVQKIDVGDLYSRAEKVTSSPAILVQIAELKNVKVRKIRNDILAEINSRLSYGLSCFLMVAIGAALGLIFRGGQVITAFCTCMVPAAIVIIMIIMGKQMITSLKVQDKYGLLPGLACMWAGNLVLLTGCSVIYWRLTRK
ncbi:MAG: LptF/LptG family permease [Planctomycetes bacterium]|nr:LptF/LptG family permease [Planctomycetota bacterium]